MKQNEKLTQEQERLMYQFRYDWINFVLQSNNSNNINNDYNDNDLNFLQIYNKIKEDIWWRYEKTRLKNKKPIILIANSYLEEKLMIIFVNLSQTLLAQIGEQEKTRVWEQIKEQIKSQVGAQVWGQIEWQEGEQVIEQLGEQVEKKIRQEVKEQVWDGLWNLVTWQVRKKVWEQVWTQVMDQVEGQVGHVRVQVCWQGENQVMHQVLEQVIKNKKLKFKFVEQHFGLGVEYGSSFYEYFKKIGIIEDEEEFEKYVRPYKAGKIWSIQYFENFVFICRLPKK